MQDKIKKLWAVINGTASSENEKAIARRMLDAYEKLGHDINISFDKVDWREFSFKGGSRNSEKIRFLGVVLRNIMNDEELEGRRVLNHADYAYSLELTLSEFIEVNERFEFYWNHYQKEKEKAEIIFLRAYIGKNNLWAKQSEADKEKNGEEWTKEQIEQARLARVLQDGIDKADYLVRLNP